jgi:hypothetical protein
MVIVRPRDKVMFLELNREKGADGEVTCEVSISTDGPLLPGKPAKRNMDFELPDPCIVTFKSGESSQKLRINMPGTSVQEESVIEDQAEPSKIEGAELLANEADKTNQEPADEPESVHFIVELKNPTGQAKLSKKKSCFVEIRPQSLATDEAL